MNALKEQHRCLEATMDRWNLKHWVLQETLFGPKRPWSCPTCLVRLGGRTTLE